MPAGEPHYQKLIAAYANYFEVGHNAFEFLFDFGQVDPQSGEINLNSRIAVGPAHAKLFLQLIKTAISQFETEFGVIPELQEYDTSSTILDFTPELERRAIIVRRRKRAASGMTETEEYGKAYQNKTDIK